jgi:tetratricopeptide (TPR) repeat protein
VLYFQLAFSAAAYGLDWTGTALDGNACVGGAPGSGPYDYFEVRDPSSPLFVEGKLGLETGLHLDKGLKDMAPEPIDQPSFQVAAAEFDFMLRYFPNHPDALKALVDLYQKKRRADRWRTGTLRSAYPPPECYFQRAIAFRPKQPHIYLLFGLYLQQVSLLEKAIQQYAAAENLNPNNAELQYNLGLCYFELKDYSAAAAHAKLAYGLGYPLPGLRLKLEKIGMWK